MEILREAKEKLGTYREVAKYLGVTPGMLTKVEKGATPMPADMACRLAELLGKPPLRTMAEVMANQQLDTKKRKDWSRWASAACIVGAVMLSGLTSESRAGMQKSDFDACHCRTH